MELTLLAGTDVRRTFQRAQQRKEAALTSGASIIEGDADELGEEMIGLLGAQSLFSNSRLLLLKNVFTHEAIADRVLAWCKDQKKNLDSVYLLEVAVLPKASESALLTYIKKHGEVVLSDLPQEGKRASRTDVYHFVDTWLRGDIKGVLKEYAMITRMGMTPEELFWAIHWQIQALGYVAEAARVHAGEDAIARATKLHPYVVSKCMRVIKGMAPGFLTRTFSRLRAIDVQIKTTPSKFDDVFLYFLITS